MTFKPTNFIGVKIKAELDIRKNKIGNKRNFFDILVISLSLATLASDPEKLLQVAFSLIIFSTIDFGKQV